MDLLASANLLTAFLAGLLSFFSPCTLPLAPLFLSHLTGMQGEELARAGAAARGRLVRHTAAFIVGFSLVFILLFGLPAGLIGQALQSHRDMILRLGGVFLIALGLAYLGLFRLPILSRQWRPRLGGVQRGRPFTSLLVGATFALGWTPCIGVILAAINTLALAGANSADALLLLAAYALGLGIPFMALALSFGRVLPLLRGVTRYLPVLNRLAGAFIVVIGLCMLAGAYQAFFTNLIRLVPWTPPL